MLIYYFQPIVSIEGILQKYSPEVIYREIAYSTLHTGHFILGIASYFSAAIALPT